jgi:hypothetical protein
VRGIGAWFASSDFFYKCRFKKIKSHPMGFGPRRPNAAKEGSSGETEVCACWQQGVARAVGRAWHDVFQGIVLPPQTGS